MSRESCSKINILLGGEPARRKSSMKTKKTAFANILYICDDHENVVGIRINPGKYQRKYYVGDIVKVTDDGCGYICPGIRTPGKGRIVSVHEDDTDHFFTIEMENGEIGRAVKANRLEVVRSTYNI